MKEYKRLTKWETSKGVKCVKYWQYSQEQIAERLALLEDKIENGTLIELPCDIGEEVYFIRQKYGQYKVFYGNVEYFRLERNFKGRKIEKRLLVGIRKYDHPYGTNYHRADELNKSWFLTKAEAEKKLKELQNEQR